MIEGSFFSLMLDDSEVSRPHELNCVSAEIPPPKARPHDQRLRQELGLEVRINSFLDSPRMELQFETSVFLTIETSGRPSQVGDDQERRRRAGQRLLQARVGGVQLAGVRVQGRCISCCRRFSSDEVLINKICFLSAFSHQQ